MCKPEVIRRRTLDRAVAIGQPDVKLSRSPLRGDRHSSPPSPFLANFGIADNTGVEQLDQHCAVSKDLPLRLAGCFRHSGQYEVAEQVRSWGHYRCGAVSRGVLHLESVPGPV